MTTGAPFNVRDFGAVGDGTTDDTVAIQAAVSASITAGALLVGNSEDTYKITAGVHMAQVGYNQAVTHNVNIANLNLYFWNTSGLLHYRKGDITIDNCKFLGDVNERPTPLEYTKENPSMNGFGQWPIHTKYAIHGINNVDGWQTATKTEGTVIIKNCLFKDIHGTGIAVGSTQTVVVKDNEFYDMGKAFAWIWLSDADTALSIITGNIAKNGGLFPSGTIDVDGVSVTMADNYDPQSAFGLLTTGGRLIAKNNYVENSASIAILHNFGKTGTEISDNYIVNDHSRLKSSNPPLAIWDEFCEGETFIVKNNTIILKERVFTGAPYSGGIWLSVKDMSVYEVSGNTIDIDPLYTDKYDGIQIHTGAPESGDTDIIISNNNIRGGDITASARHGLVFYSSNILKNIKSLTLTDNIIDGKISYDYIDDPVARNNKYQIKPSGTTPFNKGVGIRSTTPDLFFANGTSGTFATITLDRGIYDFDASILFSFASVTTAGTIKYSAVVSDDIAGIPVTNFADANAFRSFWAVQSEELSEYEAVIHARLTIEVTADNTPYYFRWEATGTAIGNFGAKASYLVTRMPVDY